MSQPSIANESATGSSQRIVSVDVLRALDILLMVFVNDLEATKGVPGWIPHIQPPDSDGMTLADVVFPAFLFIAGMSIPLAFERALASGVSRGALLLHVLVRTASLLVLGVLMVNEIPDTPGWTPALWQTLLYGAMILACSAPAGPPAVAGPIKWILRIAGIATLAYLAWIFHRVHPELPGTWLHTEWWGILGLIGWAYLAASLLYLAVGRNRELLLGGAVLLMTLYLSRSAGVLDRLGNKPWLDFARPAIAMAGQGLDWVDSYVSLGAALGSLASITVLGAVLGTILVPGSNVAVPRDRLRWAGVYALGLAIGAFLLDTFHGINKIAATPSWCLWSSALTCGAWMLLYWLFDCRRIRAPRVLTLTGANPLLAYFLHPLLLGALGLAGVTLHAQWSEEGPGHGMVRSAVIVFVVMLLTAGLARLGLRVRL